MQAVFPKFYLRAFGVALLALAAILYLSAHARVGQESLIDRAQSALSALEHANYTKLAEVSHNPTVVQFLPYIYELGEVRSVSFGKAELSDLMEQQTALVWGTYDGSGEPIKLTPREYHDTFVYDVDYATITVAKLLDGEAAHSARGLRSVVKHFAGSSFVLYRYEGTPSAAYNDWKALLLVFHKFDDQWFLIGIGHGEKTV